MGISFEGMGAHLVLVHLAKPLSLCKLSIRPEFSYLGDEGWRQSKCPVLINNESLESVGSQVPKQTKIEHEMGSLSATETDGTWMRDDSRVSVSSQVPIHLQVPTSHSTPQNRAAT